VLPFLGPSGGSRVASNGAESLGAHCEGPFINPLKNGIHNKDVLLTPQKGFEDLEDCYGASNLHPSSSSKSSSHSRPDAHSSNVKLITLAPELPHILSAIPRLTDLDIVASIGHTDATYEEGQSAVASGATMITHLFNAMRPFGHRNPGIFGLLGQTPHTSPLSTPVKRQSEARPYFGIIADGIHLHPTSIKIAFNSHPSGLILVTDAMRLAGLPDGTYDWTNGDRIIKQGALLTLEGTDGKIAGSSITLIECVNNFLHWSGSNIAEAVKAVTVTPAAMLGLQGVKGSLESDADADLVVLSEDVDDNGLSTLSVDQVWKFGSKVFDQEE
jgi:N-acetylglucosamine-6-phosphate deacetylase